LANTITVSYSGTIVSSSLPGVANGSSFTGSATYSDQETLADYFSAPTVTAAWFASPGDKISLAVDGYEFSFEAPSTPPSGVLWTWQQNFGQSGNQDGFGATANALTGNPGTFTTNYPDSALLQIATVFAWPTGILVPGVLPDPFDVTDLDLQLGLPASGYITGVSVYVTPLDGTPLDGIVGLITEVQVTSTPEPRTGLWLGALLLAFLPARSLHRRLLARR
jgi:hypothetical protein